MVATNNEMVLNYTKEQNRIAMIVQNIKAKKIRSLEIQMKANKPIKLSNSGLFSVK